MSLFKKRKTEEIKIAEYSPEQISEEKKVPIPIEKNPVSRDERIKSIQIQAKHFQQGIKKWTNAHLVNKVFSFIFLAKKDLENQLQAIDRHFIHLCDVEKVLDTQLPELETMEDTVMLELEEQINQQILILQGVGNLIEDARQRYYNHLKIATLSVCMNRTNLELENMVTLIQHFLKEFKDLHEAAEFIFYNSGNLIIETIHLMVEHFKKQKNNRYEKMYPLKYFVKTDAIITLSFTEWVDLYNKLKFVIKMTPDSRIASNIDFMNAFHKMEMRYLILMMHIEAGEKNS